VVVTPELVKPLPAGTQVEMAMPKPFLKDGATKLPEGNLPDAQQLPAQPQVPFEPTSTKPATPPVQPPAGGAGSSIRNSMSAPL
jgi:hypothetical protein